MRELTPTRPWWEKRRWRLAIAAWLLSPVAYLLSAGPACYACRADWLSVEVYNAVWGRPISHIPMPWRKATGYYRYFDAWVWLSRTHFPQ